MCAPCPAHALCEDAHVLSCESSDYLLQSSLLSHFPLIRSIVPLSMIAPTCEPDEEKTFLAADLADEAENRLRLWRGDIECSRQAPFFADDDAQLKYALPLTLVYEELKAAAGHGHITRGQDDDFFQELWDLALDDLQSTGRVSLQNNALWSRRSALGLGIGCRLRIVFSSVWRRLRFYFGVALVSLVSTQWILMRVRRRQSIQKQAQSLVDVVIGKLQVAKQRSQSLGNTEEPYLPITQLRDTVLRHEPHATKRAQLWARVSRIIEVNTNVRTRQAKVQGEWTKVWEWIGVLEAPQVPASRPLWSQRPSVHERTSHLDSQPFTHEPQEGDYNVGHNRTHSAYV